MNMTHEKPWLGAGDLARIDDYRRGGDHELAFKLYEACVTSYIDRLALNLRHNGNGRSAHTANELEVARKTKAGEPTEDEDQDDDLASFEPIDLLPAYRGEKPRPTAEVFRRDDGVAVLSAGLGGLFGDSGDGKSLVVTIAAVEEIRAGHAVVWVTYEDANEDLMVDRLRLFGISEDELALVRFIVPQTGLSHGVDRIVELADASHARLVVIDSMGEAMAVGGIDESKDSEVGPWFRRTLRRLHDLRPDLVIVPIDHSTKAKDNPLFPSGSKRKRAAVTSRLYLLNASKPFAVGEVGYVQLIVAKDRGGTFRKGDIAAEITLDATVTPYTWEVKAPREGDTYSPKLRRRSAPERVIEVLGESAVPMTAEAVARIANDQHHVQQGEARLSIGTVKNALTKLTRAAEARRILGEKVAGRLPQATWQATGHDCDGSEAVET